MSRFSGRQYKGASREAKGMRRLAAEERNARTPVSRRRAYREGTPELRLLMGIFAGGVR